MSSQIIDNPFASSHAFEGKQIHLGISGSVACYKICDLLRAFLNIGLNISATLSAGAKEFISPLLVKALGAEPVYGEMFDSAEVFGHLEPGRKADCMLIAPASADMLAKMAYGLCADMLSAQFVAHSGPNVIAPAMNPRMWANAATQANISLLVSRGSRLVEPKIGKTACGEVGKGPLADLCEIFLVCLKALTIQDMANLNVLVTLGPTREYWDSARFWSNPSSGKMGAALATAAWLRGASVTAICGPGIQAYLPMHIERIEVENAEQMLAVATRKWPAMDIGLFCAAVADFKPVPAGNNIKVKKDAVAQEFDLKFRRNPDILATIAQHGTKKILGFAAEATPDMESLLPLAKAKLIRKNANLIAANRINGEKSAFGADEDAMAIVDKSGRQEIWPAKAKADVAWDLLSWLLQI